MIVISWPVVEILLQLENYNLMDESIEKVQNDNVEVKMQ